MGVAAPRPGALLGLVDPQRQRVGLGQLVDGHVGVLDRQAVHLAGEDPPLLGQVDVVPGRQRAAPVEDDRAQVRRGVAAHQESLPRTSRMTSATTSSAGDLATLAGGAVLDLDDAVLERLADHDDGRDADQLGVLELHAGADLLAVVVEHRQPWRLERAGDLLGLGEDLGVAGRVLAGGDDVHVDRADLARPAQAELVVVALGDAGDGARDADAVGAHGDGLQLAVLVEHLEVERLGVLACRAGRCGPSRCRGRTRARARSSGRRRRARTSAASMVPSAVKSRPATRSITCLPGSLAPVTQRVPSTTRGSSEVADLRGRLGAQRAGADVALDQRRVGGEVLLVEGLHLGRLDLGARAASRRSRGRRARRWPAARGCRRGGRA